MVKGWYSEKWRHHLLHREQYSFVIVLTGQTDAGCAFTVDICAHIVACCRVVVNAPRRFCKKNQYTNATLCTYIERFSFLAVLLYWCEAFVCIYLCK